MPSHPLRRPRARRDRGGRRARRRCRPDVDRAHQALHDDRHGQRPGQDIRASRQRHRRDAARAGAGRARCADVSAAVRAGQLCAPRRPGSRRAARPGPHDADPGVARRPTAPCSRTSASGSARATSRATASRWTRRFSASARAARRRGGHGRHDPRQDRPPGPGRREFLDRMYTNSFRRSRSARAGTASCAAPTGWSSTTA